MFFQKMFRIFCSVYKDQGWCLPFFQFPFNGKLEIIPQLQITQGHSEQKEAIRLATKT